ncbi:zinc finger protein interacting with ribonucleoprotein K-like [Battus philenor]|uniref:zinc finger protein interacting with ribonucleoprotein K-like n=1 Tax=Battus philenor TaxID=42288 RepID=UPI0035CF7375
MDGMVRSVNVVPLPKLKIKKELLSEDEDEDTVMCSICCKNFANDVALRNHARMEHVEAYISGDSSLWTEKVVPKKPMLSSLSSDKRMIEEKTRELIATMGPTSMMSLASKDVSYIIVKSEGEPETSKKKKTDKLDSKKDNKLKSSTQKKDKEPQPITGPFECLQPSNLVADGTCHQIFFSCCEYSTHYRDEHTRRRKGLRCQVCEKPLNTTGEAQSLYFCDICGTGFQNNRELSEHSSKAHVKLKPFECTICHKRFTQQGGLQQHTRMHTGYRPYTCTVCSKSFTQKSGLDQHFRIHTKVRPYRCVICNKTFCQSVHLKQHMRTHTNVSPFQCGICEKRFKQSSHLNYHLKYHNPATMTEEQKKKYMELVGMIGKETVEIKVECETEMEMPMVTEVSTEYVLDGCETVGDETWCVSLN